MTPNQASARLRSGAGNVAVISASTCGTMAAPVSPCSSRAPTSSAGDWARPHSREATAKVATPIMNIRRYPTRSPSRPPVTMPLAYMNAYPPTISCRAASLTCRSRCSEGAATFTTQMSKPAMNMASSTTGSISQRREPGGDAVSVTTLPQQFGGF